MFWTTRTGNKIALPEMTDGHLYNAISLLRRLNSRWATEKLQTLLSELARRQGKVRETMSIRTPTSARTEVYDEKIQTQGRMHPTDFSCVLTLLKILNDSLPCSRPSEYRLTDTTPTTTLSDTTNTATYSECWRRAVITVLPSK
jgi:hypothetical protein